MHIIDHLAYELIEDIQEFFKQNPHKLSDNATNAWQFIFASCTKHDRSQEETVQHISNLKQVKNPLDWLVLAALLYAANNLEKTAWASALCFRTTKHILAFRFLNIALMRMDANEGFEEYLRPKGSLSNYYRRLARTLFYSDKMDLCDHYLQRRLALKNNVLSQTDEIKNCRDYLDQKEWESVKLEKFTHETREDAGYNFNKWLHSSNKQQLAFAVAELMFANRLRTCLELGSHAGALLLLIKDFFTTWKYDAVLAGIEPDPCPFELAREKVPGAEFHLGNHELLKTWDSAQDVLLCSFVCLLCSPYEMETILDFAQKRVKFIVIADDLTNMFNERPRIRRYYIIHPFAKLLSDHGFEVVDKVFLEDPNEAANGILIGMNYGLSLNRD